MAFDLEEYTEVLLAAYVSHGVLLSDGEILLVEKSIDADRLDIVSMLVQSREQLDRDLSMQMRTLEEAEEAKREAEKARDIANELNTQLEAKNRRTEADLAHEREVRSRQDKTNFQRQFATYLIALIAGVMLLPYVGAAFSAPEKLMDSTGNLSLLLIQTLGVIAGFLFNRRQDEEEPKKGRK